jgi:hypothetical protein
MSACEPQKKTLRDLFRDKILHVGLAVGLAMAPHPGGFGAFRDKARLVLVADEGLKPAPRRPKGSVEPRARHCEEATLGAVLRVLVDHADEYGVCWPSPRRIARSAHCSLATVKRALRSLARLGRILRLERWRVDGPTARWWWLDEPKVSVYRVLLRPLDPKQIAKIPDVLKDLDLEAKILPPHLRRHATVVEDGDSVDVVEGDEDEAPPSAPPPPPPAPAPPAVQPLPEQLERVHVALSACCAAANLPGVATIELAAELLAFGAGLKPKKGPTTIVNAIAFVEAQVRGRKLEGPIKASALGELLFVNARRERIVEEPELRPKPGAGRKAEQLSAAQAAAFAEVDARRRKYSSTLQGSAPHFRHPAMRGDWEQLEPDMKARLLDEYDRNTAGQRGPPP